MSTPQDEQSLVDRLKELGIPEKSARYALKVGVGPAVVLVFMLVFVFGLHADDLLQKTNNDVERAANYGEPAHTCQQSHCTNHI
jgi:hypothetical protein